MMTEFDLWWKMTTMLQPQPQPRPSPVDDLFNSDERLNVNLGILGPWYLHSLLCVQRYYPSPYMSYDADNDLPPVMPEPTPDPIDPDRPACGYEMWFTKTSRPLKISYPMGKDMGCIPYEIPEVRRPVPAPYPPVPPQQQFPSDDIYAYLGDKWILAQTGYRDPNSDRGHDEYPYPTTTETPFPSFPPTTPPGPHSGDECKIRIHKRDICR